MSEIKDRAKVKIWEIVDKCAGNPAVDIPDLILSIPELAVVDREAELPRLYQEYQLATDWEKGIEYGYSQAQQDMLKAGWIKEVKE